MAVSKRVRFEVLRRDNHTCRYCHATDSALTLDHVTPTALGGTDDPSNLVAACRDCNAGKTSTSPDAALVADVRQDALRHAELVRQSYKILVERLGEREDYVEEWQEHYSYGLPDNWRDSIGRWFEMGVPIEILVDAAQKACSKTKKFPGTERFTYMCAIVWNQIQMVDHLAEAKRNLEGHFWSEEKRQEREIQVWREAYDTGWRRAFAECRKEEVRCDPVSIVVDQIAYSTTTDWPTR